MERWGKPKETVIAITNSMKSDGPGVSNAEAKRPLHPLAFQVIVLVSDDFNFSMQQSLVVVPTRSEETLRW